MKFFQHNHHLWYIHQHIPTDNINLPSWKKLRNLKRLPHAFALRILLEGQILIISERRCRRLTKRYKFHLSSNSSSLKKATDCVVGICNTCSSLCKLRKCYISIKYFFRFYAQNNHVLQKNNYIVHYVSHIMQNYA